MNSCKIEFEIVYKIECIAPSIGQYGTWTGNNLAVSAAQLVHWSERLIHSNDFQKFGFRTAALALKIGILRQKPGDSPSSRVYNEESTCREAVKIVLEPCSRQTKSSSKLLLETV